jgi:hypothetical protein
MRFETGRHGFIALFLLALGAGQVPSPAMAGGFYKEKIYGDSFGNLIIYSPSGYKRIVVGRGYVADELAAAEADPPAAYGEKRERRYGRNCYYKPMFWHGRSRMYGLPEGVVPTPPRICR